MFGGGGASLALANPIAPELSDMRPSLLPGLIAAAQRNADRGHGDVALFEVGQIFLGDRGRQVKRSPPARSGAAWRRKEGPGGIGRSPPRASIPSTPKPMFSRFFRRSALPPAVCSSLPAGPPGFTRGARATIQFGPKNVIGAFGEIHPRTLEAIGAEGPVAGFELLLDDIPAPKLRLTRNKPKLELPEFMPVQRDFAFLVDRSVKAADIVKAAAAGERALVTDVGVFDVYEGKGIPEGKKSVAISVTLQPREKTLTEAEIDAAAGKIIAEVTKRTGASLRG